MALLKCLEQALFRTIDQISANEARQASNDVMILIASTRDTAILRTGVRNNKLGFRKHRHNLSG